MAESGLHLLMDRSWGPLIEVATSAGRQTADLREAAPSLLRAKED
jgi:hypothetical protein